MKNRIFLFLFISALTLVLNFSAWSVTPASSFKQPHFFQEGEKVDALQKYMHEEVFLKRMDACKKASLKWQKGSMMQMREGYSDYIEALQQIMVDLGEKYYSPEDFGKKSVKNYMDDLVDSIYEFYSQKLTGPTHKAPTNLLGTVYHLDLAQLVADELEERIADMVAHVAEEDKDSTFDYEAWLKAWEASQEDRKQEKNRKWEDCDAINRAKLEKEDIIEKSERDDCEALSRETAAHDLKCEKEERELKKKP